MPIKKMMIMATVLGFVLLSVPATALAWDPVGVWKIEGRNDATIDITKDGDLYRIQAQSAYSKYNAVGVLVDSKMYFVATFTSEKLILYCTFSRLDENRMEMVSRYPDNGGENGRNIFHR